MRGLSQHMSFGLIFELGLLTGFHCVGTCGKRRATFIFVVPSPWRGKNALLYFDRRDVRASRRLSDHPWLEHVGSARAIAPILARTARRGADLHL